MKRNKMKNKTWQKIGEVLLDYSKILITIGLISPFINDKKIGETTEYGIIVLVVIFIITGLITYNKGAIDE